MNLIQEGLNIIKERKIEFAPKFIPYLIASYGCHVFNLVNQQKQIFFHGRRIPDMRMHILFTAPPGFSKSLFLKSLTHPKYGLLYTNALLKGDGTPAMDFMVSCTEAGWTGSSAVQGSGLSYSMGAAEEFKNGIVAMEEFKAFIAIMAQDHSSHMEQMINVSLFGGDIRKRLKGLDLKYHTDITLWAGNQVMNFDISGGLFRRLSHMLWVPRLVDAERLKDAIWAMDNLPPKKSSLSKYRNEVEVFVNRVNSISSVEFDPQLRKVMNSAPHYEQVLFRNLALGYTLMSESRVPRKVVVDPTPELESLIDNTMRWRKQLLADPQGYQILQLMLDLSNGKPLEWLSWSDIRNRNLIYSTSYDQTDEVLGRLIRQRRVEYSRQKGMLRIA